MVDLFQQLFDLVCWDEKEGADADMGWDEEVVSRLSVAYLQRCMRTYRSQDRFQNLPWSKNLLETRWESSPWMNL